MTHILRLELKKYKVHRMLLCAAILIMVCIFFITVSLLDSAYDPAQTKDSFDSTFKVAGLLLSCIFLIYSSLLTSIVIIGEYNNKTMTILFTYPLDRRLLILGKLLIIMTITALSMAIGYLCCCSYLYIVDMKWNLLEGSFEVQYAYEWMKSALISTVVCTILSVCPFIVGMIRKSVAATLISSLFVIVARQVLIAKNETNMESLLQMIIIVLITGICTCYVFQKKLYF